MKRKIFVIFWCLLSCVGILFQDFQITFLGVLLLGFHTPRDTLYYMGLYARFSEYPWAMLVNMAILVIFVFIFVVAICKLKKSMLFEYLIVGDSVIALATHFMALFLNNSSWTDVWPITMALAVKIVLSFVLLYFSEGNRFQQLKARLEKS